MRPCSLASESQQSCDSSLEFDHRSGIHTADASSDVGASNGGDLVDHCKTRHIEAGGCIIDDRQSEQGGINGRGGEWADRHRIGGIESVVLHNDGRTRFRRIDAASDEDDVTALDGNVQLFVPVDADAFHEVHVVAL